MEVPTDDQRARRAAILQTISGIEDGLFAGDPDLSEKMARWETRMNDLMRDWTVLDPEAYYGAVGTKFAKLSDKSLLATASSPPVSGYTISVRTKMTNITGFRLEVLPGTGKAKAVGHSKTNNFVLSEF